MDIMYLPGVGPKRAELLRKELNVSTVGDLLRLYPFRYIDKSSFVRICDARPDMAYIQMKAMVMRLEVQDNKRLRAWVSDGSGEMELVFFKGIKWMHDRLKPGSEWIFFGKPQVFNGRINMVHPEVDPVPGGPAQAAPDGPAQALPPAAASTTVASYGKASMAGVYPSTERLKNAGVTGKMMSKIMEAALEKGLGFENETLPEYIMKQLGIVPLRYALRNIHFPQDFTSLEKARYRLKFEELFFLQLSLLKQKYVRSRDIHGIHMPRVGEAFNKCYESLPFPLTGAQKRVITEIRNDMKSGQQMNRLLQGDVGSGKTMVALMSMLLAVDNGFQACMMAPTEILARQHYATIVKMVGDIGLRLACLTGTTKQNNSEVAGNRNNQGTKGKSPHSKEKQFTCSEFV